jgi:LysM domain
MERMSALPIRRKVVPLVALIAAAAITVPVANQLRNGASRSEVTRGIFQGGASTSRSEPRAQERATTAVPPSGTTVTRALAEPLDAQSGQHAPTFDIARIERSGEAVIAGRASAGVTVELLRDNEVLSRAVADQSGEFVIVPLRLPVGTYKLTLRSKQPDGSELTSKQSVSVALETLPNEHSIAALKTAVKPTAMPPHSAIIKGEDNLLVFEAIAVDSDGKFHVRGRARPSAPINLYLNDNFIASVTSGADEQFSVTINEGVSPGAYRVRLEEVQANSGIIIARSEAAFHVPAAATAASASVQPKRTAQDNTPAEVRTEVSAANPMLPKEGGSPSDVVIPKVVTATVIHGDSLWSISRHTYGAGERYPAIFGANRKQIRNPDLIYPGQIFVLPAR